HRRRGAARVRRHPRAGPAARVGAQQSRQSLFRPRRLRARARRLPHRGGDRAGRRRHPPQRRPRLLPPRQARRGAGQVQGGDRTQQAAGRAVRRLRQAARQLGGAIMKAVYALLALILVAIPAPDVAAQTSSGVKGMLGGLWGRLRAATPRSTAATQTTTVTAGLRGSEATASELKPYWRGDRESDPSSISERQALESAQALADAGKFADAAKAFESFT